MKILICDDDRALLSMIRFRLERENLGELFIANNGDTAVKLMKEHEFDLLITDIHMPHYNGDEIMKIMHDDSQKIKTPVIMMSSDGDEDVIALAKKQGVKHFVVKPFKIEGLVKLIKSILQPARK